MEAKHTPGPWFAQRQGFSTVYIEARIRAGVLQEVAACGPTEAGSEQQDANARLIAASPDLLEALIELEDQADLSLDYRPEFRRAIASAHAAIVKATGSAA